MFLESGSTPGGIGNRSLGYIVGHNQKITVSTFEEYGLNSTHLKDRILLATPRLLAGWVKMPGERDCFARFEKGWVYN